MTPATIGTLGVMCCTSSGNPPFSGEGYCRTLARAGRKYGIDVIAFTPEGVSLDRSSVTGFLYRHGEWHETFLPFPDIVYDRCFFHKGREFKVAANILSEASQANGWMLWSRGLPGKWHVHQVLKREPSLLPHLPPTSSYKGASTLVNGLRRYGNEMFMKPKSGSQGKNTLYIRQDSTHGSLTVKGRTSNNNPFAKKFPSSLEGYTWIRQFTGERPYLIQPFLHLYSQEGSPFDVRVLMQKNEKGLWMHTGMALRLGNPESITSNLHGGGTALSVLPFLCEQFGAAQAEHMSEVLHNLSENIPPILESRYGRLGELGIDFGIDKKGKIWLLEVNSKPGRTSFRQIGDPRIEVLASENPLRYARYLLLRQLRRVN